MKLPERRHTYQHHHFDSTRWNYFVHRPGDIVITTSYKAGTTWMQGIVGNLLFPDGMPASRYQLSPWLDDRSAPLEVMLNTLGAQRHRRFIKTHLPLDGLPYYPDVQYIVVARDARDVFVSLLNHWRNHTPEFYRLLNGIPDRVGAPFPEYVDDVPARWRDWITRGWFDWESDGYPYWSHLHHAKTWWEFRHLPNVKLVHYADLLADLGGEMRAIADYLGVDVPASQWPHVVDACTFAAMKRKALEVDDAGMRTVWKDGANTFFNKGTNGRWRDMLSASDLALYDAAVKKTLPDDCARWLENGGTH